MNKLFTSEQSTIMKTSIQAILNKLIVQKRFNVWIILEVAKDDLLAEAVQKSNERHYLLEEQSFEVNSYGPVAICINTKSELHSFILDNWGKKWFSIFATNIDKSSLLPHLRNLVYIQGNEDETTLFRFYEPAVIGCWIDGLEKAKKYNDIFGIFEAIYVEDILTNQIIEFLNKDLNVHKQYIDLLNFNPAKLLSLPRDEYFLKVQNDNWQMSIDEKNALENVPMIYLETQILDALLEDNLQGTNTESQLYELIKKYALLAISYQIEEQYLIYSFVKTHIQYEQICLENKLSFKSFLEDSNISSDEKIELFIDTVLQIASKIKG